MLIFKFLYAANLGKKIGAFIQCALKKGLPYWYGRENGLCGMHLQGVKFSPEVNNGKQQGVGKGGSHDYLLS